MTNPSGTRGPAPSGERVTTLKITRDLAASGGSEAKYRGLLDNRHRSFPGRAEICSSETKNLFVKAVLASAVAL
jgi:hypothetical protein